MQYEESARKILDAYLQKVKTYLGSAKTADPEDVVRDVTEHIENELGDTTQPISAAELDAVLKRLGEPKNWVDENDLSWWRKFLLRLRGGPESWRLAYLTIGLILFGFLCFGIEPGLFFISLLLSFLTARGALSTAGDPSDLPKGQKWLIYPPLILVYAFIAFWLLTWPIFAGAGIAVEYVTDWGSMTPNVYGNTYALYGLHEQGNRDLVILTLVGCIGGPLLSLWLLIVGIVGLFKKPRRFLAAVFYPFLNPSSRKLSLWILLLAVFVLLFNAAFITITILNTKPA
jgi:hypothetical protein